MPARAAGSTLRDPWTPGRARGGDGPLLPVPPVPAPAGTSVLGESASSAPVRGRAANVMPRRWSRGRPAPASSSRVPSLVTVSVDGRRVRTIRPGSLAVRYAITLSARRLRPGLHVVRIRVTFELGSGTSPATMTRRVRVCAARVRAPRFTG